MGATRLTVVGEEGRKKSRKRKEVSFYFRQQDREHLNAYMRYVGLFREDTLTYNYRKVADNLNISYPHFKQVIDGKEPCSWSMLCRICYFSQRDLYISYEEFADMLDAPKMPKLV